MERYLACFKKNIVTENRDKKQILFLDSTCIKAHFNACGARGGNEKIGKTKGGINTKVTVACDEYLNPLYLQIDSGNKSDMKIGEEIANLIQSHTVLVADKGYDSNKIRDRLKKRKIRSVIPYRKNRKKKKRISKVIYKQSNVIERFFLKLKKFRRINTRYDKRSSTFYSFVVIAFICLMIGL